MYIFIIFFSKILVGGLGLGLLSLIANIKITKE